MDLAEKRRQLKEIRAAREAKQRSVLNQQNGAYICKTSSALVPPLNGGPLTSHESADSFCSLVPPCPPSAKLPWPLVVGIGPASAAPSSPSAIFVPPSGKDFVAESQRTPSPDLALMIARSLRANSLTGSVRCVHDMAVLGMTSAVGVECLLVATALSIAYECDTVRPSTVTDLDSDDAGGVLLLWAAPVSSNAVENGGFVVPLKSLNCEVLRLTYTRHRPNLLFGGTESGRVIVWRVDAALASLQDGRAVRLRTDALTPDSAQPTALLVGRAVDPADASFPSPHAHQTRVLALAVHGDANYHHLYSVSEDARVCMWAPSSIRQPSSSREASVAGKPFDSIGCCAAFVDKAADALSKVFVGSASGQVLEGRAKSLRAVELRLLSHAPHRAAIVALAPHPLHADSRVSDAILSAASDGTCALWLGASHIAIEGFDAVAQCLRWSPVHSGVFVAGEANGRVAVWDLTRSASSPVASVYLRSCTVPEEAQAVAVTSLAFAEDGAWLACGNAAGEVFVLRLHENLVTEVRGSTPAGEVVPSWIDACFV